MTIKRRQLLQITGLTLGASPLGVLLAESSVEPYLQWVIVRDDLALPGFAAGDLLLTDTRETRYSGDGIYLYPHWGAPRPYQISLVAAFEGQSRMLEFRNPGTQQLLWTQSFAPDSQFAGKLTQHFSSPNVVSETGKYPLLRLPTLPSSADMSGFEINILDRV
jgi:hypothetical protein